MKKKKIFSLIFISMFFGYSCTSNEYEINEDNVSLDVQVGKNDLSIRFGEMEKQQLSDLLDLDDNGEIILDDDNYKSSRC